MANQMRMREKFIGRSEELNFLESQWARDDFQMTVIYGRRRIGKSTLLARFAEGKRCIFFNAVEGGAPVLVPQFGQAVFDVLSPNAAGLASFRDFDGIFGWISSYCGPERLLIILDEFPRFAGADRSVLSVLQRRIDLEWRKKNIFLILCGSSVSFMEEDVLGAKSPLFGRRTAQLEIKPFSFREAAQFVPSYSPEDKALSYAVTGGVAQYLAHFDESASVHANIERLLFTSSGCLFEEPMQLLRTELRNIPLYFDVLHALSAGKTTVTEIAGSAQADPASAVRALDTLIQLRIVEKTAPVTEEGNRRKNRYGIRDSLFRFWFRFVANNTAAINRYAGSALYEKAVRPQLPLFMGPVFEEMCRDFTLGLGLAGRLPCFVTQVGKWWGTDPARKERTDIDVVGLDPLAKRAVIGECKFRNEILGKAVFDALKDRDGLIDRHYRTDAYLLFSKSGFSDWILENAGKERILHFTLAEMYGDELPPLSQN